MSIAPLFASFLARLWFHLLPIRLPVARENLLRTGLAKDAAQANRLCLAMGSHLALNLLEWLTVALPMRRSGRGSLDVTGWEPVQDSIQRGCGAIIISAHLGNWEILSASARQVGIPLTLVVTPPRNRFARVWIAWLRARAGAQVTSQGAVWQAARESLRQGRVVGMMVDQRPPPRQGLPGTFLGQPALLPTAPALLAIRTGATVFSCVAIRQENGEHRVQVEGPLPFPPAGPGRDKVAFLAREMNARVETWVRAHPSQWLWLHRRWANAPVGNEPLPVETP